MTDIDNAADAANRILFTLAKDASTRQEVSYFLFENYFLRHNYSLKDATRGCFMLNGWDG